MIIFTIYNLFQNIRKGFKNLSGKFYETVVIFNLSVKIIEQTHKYRMQNY